MSVILPALTFLVMFLFLPHHCNANDCFYIEMRNIKKPAPSIQEGCTNVPPSGSEVGIYSTWFPPLFAAAFDEAERATCGNVGCMFSNKHVRLIVQQSPLLNAGIREINDSVDIVFTTSLVDFVEGIARGIVDDGLAKSQGRDPKFGYDSWRASLLALGGDFCTINAPMPSPNINNLDMKLVRGISHTIYQFIISHELAHYRLGNRCGYNGPANNVLKAETACDQAAISAILNKQKDNQALPLAIVAFNVAIDDYHLLVDPKLLQALQLGGTTFRSAFPATDYRSRAKEVVAAWEAKCKSGGKIPACSKGWEAGVEHARKLIATPKPAKCFIPEKAGNSHSKKTLPTNLCQTLKAIKTAADKGFVNLIGDKHEKTEEYETWTTNVSIDMFSNGTVWANDDGLPGRVTYDFDSGKDLNILSDEYLNLKNAVAACFPKASSGERVRGSSITTRSFIVDNGSPADVVVRFVTRKKNRTGEVRIDIE